MLHGDGEQLQMHRQLHGMTTKIKREAVPVIMNGDLFKNLCLALVKNAIRAISNSRFQLNISTPTDGTHLHRLKHDFKSKLS